MILAVDLGSTTFKAGVFDEAPALRGSGSRPLRYRYGPGGRVELEADEVTSAFEHAIRAAIDEANLPPEAIHALGPRYVVIKGGHLEANPADLLYDGQRFVVLRGERIATPHTHGTGCTFASAIAAGLAKGLTVEQAVREAKAYITEAIRHALPLGHGHGPTNHFAALYKAAGWDSQYWT